MRQTFVVVLLLTFLFASLALPQSNKSSKKTPSRKTIAKKGKSSSAKAGKRTAPAAYRQASPTPERYKEIQQALADKGYLKSASSGVWDADSSAALAKFQSDRNLTPTGKLSAASLIALGLGPSTAPIPGNANIHPAADGAPVSPPISSSSTSN